MLKLAHRPFRGWAVPVQSSQTGCMTSAATVKVRHILPGIELGMNPTLIGLPVGSPIWISELCRDASRSVSVSMLPTLYQMVGNHFFRFEFSGGRRPR